MTCKILAAQDSCALITLSHVGKYRHCCPRLNMNPASASDWRAKRFGLDIDRLIIAIIRKFLENLVLRDKLAVGHVSSESEG